jgi:hypothetical protein
LTEDKDRFDARELFRALAEHSLEYVTIGGIAVQAHGGQRLTRDLDIAVEASAANMQKLAAALVALDARVLGPDGRRSRSVPGAALLGSSDLWRLVSSYGRLDVLTLPAHLGSFAELRSRAHEVPLGDVTVPIANRADLMKMKQAAGRPQDLADVQLLEALDEERP